MSHRRLSPLFLRILKQPFLRSPFLGTVALPAAQLHTSFCFCKKNLPEIRRQKPKRGTETGSVTDRLLNVSTPAIDIRDPVYEDRILELSTYFPRQDIKTLAEKSPQVFFEAWIEVVAKINYALFRMNLEQPEVISCGILDYSLQHTVQRHVLLERCGIYRPKNPKKTEIAFNPSGADVVRTWDEEFLKMAGISREEWEVFCDMFELEKYKHMNPMYDVDDLPMAKTKGKHDAYPANDGEDNEEEDDLTADPNRHLL